MVGGNYRSLNSIIDPLKLGLYLGLYLLIHLDYLQMSFESLRRGRGSNYRSLKAGTMSGPISGSMSGPISDDTSRLLAYEL